MAMVEDSEFIPSAMQRLTCGGAQLCGASSLCAAGVGEADTLMLQLNVAGGMRAKWRKKRMRRLRRKRRKMRQRAR
jgi:Ribosomal protein L41